METNPGITGLNYQKLKQIFYPNETYEVMEEEISALAKEDHACVAALGSYLSAEKNALTRGGFLFDAPLSAHLKRAHFVRAALEEIAFSIKWNFDILTEVTPFERDYVWVCRRGIPKQSAHSIYRGSSSKKGLCPRGISSGICGWSCGHLQ